MAFDENVKDAIMDLDPSTLICLYTIELKDKNGSSVGFYRFHGGENGYNKNLRYGGIDSNNKNEYFYVPMIATGFDFVDQSLPRPTLRFDNTDGYFSLRANHFDDFIGFNVVRIKTFLRFLDGVNFANGVNPFGSGNESSYPHEKYIINKKNMENNQLIEFELVSAFEKEGGLIPARKIVYNVCQWKYRSSYGCGYTGGPVADESDNKFVNPGSPTKYSDSSTYSINQSVFIDNGTNDKNYFVCIQSTTPGESPITHPKKWTKDACSKNIKGCRLRFGGTSKEIVKGLPFGGFPGSWTA